MAGGHDRTLFARALFIGRGGGLDGGAVSCRGEIAMRVLSPRAVSGRYAREAHASSRGVDHREKERVGLEKDVGAVGNDGGASLRIAQVVMRRPFYRQFAEPSYDYRSAVAERFCHGGFNQAYADMDILSGEIARSVTDSVNNIGSIQGSYRCHLLVRPCSTFVRQFGCQHTGNRQNAQKAHSDLATTRR